MWGIILMLVGVRPENLSAICRALSLVGFALWLIPHVSLGCGGRGGGTVGVFNDRCITVSSNHPLYWLLSMQ